MVVEKLSEVVEKVKQVDDGVNNIIVPLLKDTIADNNKDKKRMFIVIIFLVVAIVIISLYSQFLVMKQNEKYAEFLSQFEFEAESEVYQDVDNNSVINDGITINK